LIEDRIVNLPVLTYPNRKETEYPSPVSEV